MSCLKLLDLHALFLGLLQQFLQVFISQLATFDHELSYNSLDHLVTLTHEPVTYVHFLGSFLALDDLNWNAHVLLLLILSLL